MPPDSAYCVTAVPTEARYLACRRVLIHGAFGGVRVDRATNAEIASRYAELQALWHACLGELHGAGWSRAGSPEKLKFLRNCPPAGVRTRVHGHYCYLNRLCPFCFARANVLGPFVRLERLLDGVAGSPGRVAGPLRLFEFETRDIPCLSAARGARGSLPAGLWRLDSLVRSGRRQEAEALPGALGGVVLHRVVRRRGRLFLRRAGLFLLPQGPTPALAPRGDYRHSALRERVTRPLLVRAFDRVARYPAAWLKAPAREVMEFLYATPRLRMLSTFGLARRSKNQN